MIDRIKKVVIESLLLPEEEFDPYKTFFELGADSLDQIELLMALENEIGQPIPDDVADKMQRPIDVLNFIENVNE